MERVLKGRPIVPGQAGGVALVSKQPLSFWGGLDAAMGKLIDPRHDRCGEVITGKVFVLPGGKGSSTASAVLAESVRAGTHPAAILTLRADPILAVGAIVADELYGQTVPMVVLEQSAFDSIAEGDAVRIECDGTVKVTASGGRGCAAE